MPIKMALWKIEKDNSLDSVESKPLDSEETLENWLDKDISMISDDLLLIGRQVESDLGGVLDLLAIDRNGDLAVLELKKDKTPRDVVAQALHYAAWVRTLSWEEIDELTRKRWDGKSLADVFQDTFEQPLPDTLNTAHRIYIVAAEMDAVSETIVRYLSEEYGVNINVIFFRHFCDGDTSKYLGGSWLMEPSEVKEPGDGKRPPPLTLQQFQDLANEKGVGEQYRTLFDFFSERADETRRTKTNVTFAFKTEGGIKAAFSVYPEWTSQEKGLYTDVRAGLLAAAFSVDESDVQRALPGPGEKADYGEKHYFRSAEEARRLTEALSPSSEKAVADGNTSTAT